jgi:hypothetical protein
MIYKWRKSKMSKQTQNLKQSEIVDYLMGIIEHGTRWDLLELYNSHTNHGEEDQTDIHADEVDWNN